MKVRIDEVSESIQIIRAAVTRLPEGPHRAPAQPIPPGRCALSAVEGWRGEIVHWVRTGEGNCLERCKVKDPSINNWPAIVEAVEGNIVADFPVINKSFNLSYSGRIGSAMFKILQKSFRVGTATADYPRLAPRVAEQFRGCPEFDFAAWSDARPAAEACPTGAIAIRDRDGARQVTVDYGRCIFCGECEAASTDGAVKMSRQFELAATARRDLVLTADYTLRPDGSHAGLKSATSGPAVEEPGMRIARPSKISSGARSRLGRWMQAHATAASRRLLR